MDKYKHIIILCHDNGKLDYVCAEHRNGRANVLIVVL